MSWDTGDFFVHFLDSPEQALLVIPLYTDILPNGGATWICTEGPAKIGQWLVCLFSVYLLFPFSSLPFHALKHDIVPHEITSHTKNSTTTRKASIHT